MSDVARLEREKRRALNKDNLREAANLSNLLGQELQNAGDYEGALAQHKEEGALCEALGDTIGKAVSHRRRGEVFCDMGRWEKALHHQHQHLSLAKEAESMVEEQRAYATIGRTHLQRAEACSTNAEEEKTKSLREAEKAFLRSLSICERLKGAVDTLEHCQMRCRLYLNLGLVLDHRGNSDKACNFISQALELCASHCLHEDALRCHLARAAIFLRKCQYPQALQDGQKALMLSAKLHDKAVQCECHSFLAQVHLHNSDFEAAKKCYYKAYRLKHPIFEDRERVQKNLKIVVSICQAEDALITLGEAEGEDRLKFYEKIGDGLANFDLYSQALVYYHKLLELSLKLDKEPSFLIPVYLSLARTYYDNKQYKEAKEYYTKEYDIRLREDYKEACKTLLNIAEVEANLGEPYTSLSSTYQQARQLAVKASNPKLEAYILDLQISLKGIPDVAKSQLQEEFRKILEDNSLDPEIDLSEEDDNDDVEDDIDLDELSDSGSDSENFDKPRQLRQKKSLVVRRNEKGETPLHKACIDGNLNMVKKLLQQGHPVNPRDNCGWLPLHEAANHGFYDIVQMLVEAGAWINDRGGQQCDGISPIHDAASCGNLEVVRLLMGLGASITTKTNDGDTPLESLVKFRLRTELSETEKQECRQLEREIKEKMKQVGHKIPEMQTENITIADTQEYKTSKLQTRRSNGRQRSLCPEVVQKKTHSKLKNTLQDCRPEPSCSGRRLNEANILGTPDVRKLGSSRRCVTDDIESDDEPVRCSSPLPQTAEETASPVAEVSGADDDSEEFFNPLIEDLQQEATSATGTYLSAIGCVGSSARRAELQNSTTRLTLKKDKKVALLSEGHDVGDDWLDDDLGIYQKKRKRAEKFAFEYKEPRKERKVSSELSHQAPSLSGLKRARQTKLTALIHRQTNDDGSAPGRPTEEPDYDYLDHTVTVVPEVSSSVELSRNTVDMRPRNTGQGMSGAAGSPLRLKVRVQNRLLLVPVAGGGQDRTVAWLAEEVTRRYYQLCGLRPHLILTMQDGAVLDPSDPITLVLPTEQSELEGQVTGWDLPPLPDRYAAACQALSSPVIPALSSTLHQTEVSTTLDLSFVGRLATAQLQPVIRAIQYQHSLRCLKLANCRLGDDGFSSLMEALPSLPSLEVLDLQASSLTTTSLLELTQAITSDKLPLKTLYSLDMSYNTLSGVKLANICALLSLSALINLSLKHCGIVLMSVQQSPPSVVTSPLKTLALDYNTVDYENLSFLLSCVPSISTLTLSGLKTTKDQTCANDNISGVGAALTRVLGAGEECLLHHLDLSACSLVNTDLEDISAYLYRCPHLTSINLAHNPALSPASISTLFSELTTNIVLPLTALNLHGNKTLSHQLRDKITSTLQQKATTKHALTKFSLTTADSDKGIETLWKSQYQHKAVVQRIESELFLSCTDV